jgi:hypothetical protein
VSALGLEPDPLIKIQRVQCGGRAVVRPKLHRLKADALIALGSAKRGAHETEVSL